MFFKSAAIALMAFVSMASAASLQNITDWGGPNPTNLTMQLYVPDNVIHRPAIVLVLHYCTGSGEAMYTATSWKTHADQFGFIAIYPSATRASHCWDVSTLPSLTHNGGSDSLTLTQMIKWVISNYHADARRVFSTGVSSGAMMTDVMLATYPNVFAAGAAWSGVPYWCFRTDDPSGWNNNCSAGLTTKTPKQWGDLARAADPSYHGPRPRMQLFHGTADTVLNYTNYGEEIKQWTNVHHVSLIPTSTDYPQVNWTRTRYGHPNRHGQYPVEGYSGLGETHNMFWDGDEIPYALTFFGLNTTESPMHK